MIGVDNAVVSTYGDAGRTDPRDPNGNQYPSTVKRRREFEDYATAKSREIDEQRLSWRYYHIDQWSVDQLKVLKKRSQPPITFDRTGRKIDSLTGTIRRLRTDPKAYPNAPNGEQGAEVATQVIRTICDSSADGSMAEDLEVECCRDALIHGIGVSELKLGKGDKGDPDLSFGYIDPRTFFYDPRSTKYDFRDTRFHGVYKWADADELDAVFPGSSEEIHNAANDDGGYWTAFDSDRETMWVDVYNRVRLVDHWYKEGNIWKWCVHAGLAELMRGESPFVDARGQSISKFDAFAAYIDIHGDHYGLIRRLRGPQDAINQHRSKAIHIMNTRQIILKEGAVDDIEVTRREAARPDGVLVYRGTKGDLDVSQPEQEFIQQTNYYQDAKAEIDTFGPNQQLIQNFGQNVSGRAANMLQQAGIAELGPFLKNFRMWKLQRYRSCWMAAQKFWTSDRMLRVTSDAQVAQFMQINGVALDQYGLPTLVNALGNIDVEIRVDEGQDNETVMGDIFDLLIALAQNNVPVPPAAIIEASALPLSEKKKLQAMVAPDPQEVQAQQTAKTLQLQGMAATVGKTQAETQKLTADAGKSQTAGLLNMAKARTEGMPDAQQPPPGPLDIAQKLADINETNATAAHKRASANSLDHRALVTPLQLLADHAQRSADRNVSSMHQNADRIMDSMHRNADRKQQREQLAQQIQRNATPE